MSDEIRPSDERFRSTYESGFRTWAHLYSIASTNRKLPPDYLSPQEAFLQHPSFPAVGIVEHDGYQAFLTASSLWGSEVSTCSYKLPSFERPVQIGITAKDPIPLSVSDVAQDNMSSSSWFVNGDNYLPVLILAWTYVLSARWAELMPTTCSIEYTHALAAHNSVRNNTKTDCNDQNTVFIDVNYADQAEARWWSAVLSPGQGWRATLHLGQSTFLSPWSIDLQSDLQFLLSMPLQQSFSPPNPTFSTACEYLTRFCTHHDITDQSNAALAAVLLFPSVNDGRVLQLPAPRISRSKPPQSLREEKAPSSWVHPIHCPDRLLTLSCNTRGIRPALLSVFYEAQIECNTVTPWLQGTLSAIDTLAKQNACIIGRMCMDRTPGVAYLWLGATILGLQQRLLQDVRRGQFPFDLDSAAWTGTIQSFIQQPVSNPLVVSGHVTRADECRLLFLSRSDRYVRCPVCQWKPFGATSVEDVDVEVRVHSDCGDHKLQYQGLRWNSTGDEYLLDRAGLHLVGHSATSSFGGGEQVPVSYEALNREKEVISENATRSILGWLRSDGWTYNERKMLEHPWLDTGDSESEDEDADGDGDQLASDDGPQDLSLVTSWIDNE
jgi:hypothetical protein